MQGLTLPRIDRWSDRVVVVRGLNPGPFTGPGTNTYLMGLGKRVLLLDTGVGVPEYIELLRDALRTEFSVDAPTEIVVTHAHPDHLGGIPSIFDSFGKIPVHKMPHTKLDGSLAFNELRDGDEIRTDGVTLRAIESPGHAPDHLCFWLDEERAIFTGDVVLGAGTSIIPSVGGDMGLYLQTLERLQRLEPQRLYPGHGPLVEPAAPKLESYLHHRKEREIQIIAAIQSGATSIEAMVRRIYTDTPVVLHAAAGQSVLSHLSKLEKEARASRSVDPAGVEHWSLV